MCVCVLMATSPWGLSELWGGDVPTSNIDHSKPRLRSLLLHILLIEPAPPSPPDVKFQSGGASHSCPASLNIENRPVAARDHPTTRVSPVYVPAYQKTFARLPLTLNFQSPNPPPLPFPRHTYQIPVAAAPSLPPKSILT